MLSGGGGVVLLHHQAELGHRDNQEGKETRDHLDLEDLLDPQDERAHLAEKVIEV